MVLSKNETKESQASSELLKDQVGNLFHRMQQFQMSKDGIINIHASDLEHLHSPVPAPNT